jgi:hypothetical protein
MNNNLEQEMARQRHSKHKSQSHFMRNFPTFDLAHLARSTVKPLTTAIHHVAPILTLFGGHAGKVAVGVSGIIDKLIN